jgi:regulator of PEP synthase PpsR (kinase-PPPase family)
LGEQSLGEPGLYRRLNKAYFDRVEAIEYSMTHDDGRHPEGWSQAELVLIGPSRVGKTPLSLYLSVLGWKVANIPIVPELDPPEKIFEMDKSLVIGLTIAPAHLMAFRQERQKRLGVSGSSDYTNPERIYEELQEAEKFCKRAGIRVLDVTDKPIETSADEVIRLITGRFGTHSRAG